jgi:membrane protein DedA with SNARE-associated domain
VVGALLLYGLGRYGGRPMLLRHGRLLRLTPAKLDRADDFFDAHGAKVVLLGRMVPGVRSLVSLPAGASRMPLTSFIALTAAGSALWNAGLIGAGWALGTRWRDLTGALSHSDVVIAAAVASGGTAWLVVHARRNRA